MSKAKTGTDKALLSDEYLRKVDAYWRAANYLAAAQLYMLDNPLLRNPSPAIRSRKRSSATGAPCRGRTSCMYI